MSLEEICAPEDVTPDPTATEPPAATPTESPAEATPTSTLTAKVEATKERSAPTETPSPTVAPTKLPALTVTPAPDDGQGETSEARGAGALRINYVLFGVLVAVLVGIGVVLFFRNRRR
jgi:hypothetical protein